MLHDTTALAVLSANLIELAKNRSQRMRCRERQKPSLGLKSLMGAKEADLGHWNLF